MVFSRFFQKECDDLKIAGIVAEFNPFHNGHGYLVEQAKLDGCAVVCVLSGNFVQRGDTAVISKFNRAKMALSRGIDLCVELPVAWSMSTAQNFAFGAISQLSALGVDTLYFGSECGDAGRLLTVASALESVTFQDKLASYLSRGVTFAKARQETVQELIGDDAALLESPNDILAIEYIRAAGIITPHMKFKAVSRVGAGHNDPTDTDGYTTSTLLRSAIRENDTEYLKRFMPDSAFQILLKSPVSDISRLDTAIMARLKTMSKDDLAALPDISEGLENRLYTAIQNSVTVNELCDNMKSKRYTLARIRRLVLSAFLGVDGSLFLTRPPYVRVLGWDDTGKMIVSRCNRTIPIVTRVSEIERISANAKAVFALENRASDIYGLSLSVKEPSGSEYKNGIIIL